MGPHQAVLSQGLLPALHSGITPGSAQCTLWAGKGLTTCKSPPFLFLFQGVRVRTELVGELRAGPAEWTHSEFSATTPDTQAAGTDRSLAHERHRGA